MLSRRGDQVRVTLGINMFVPSPQGENGEEALKTQEAGRRMIYQLGARECAILLDVMASECRLESINVNAQRLPNQFGQQKVDGFNINANIGYSILPK